MVNFKFALLASLLLQGSALSQNAPAYDGNYHALWYPIGNASMPFASAHGRQFNISGKVQYFTGANAWWVPRLRNNSDIDLVMSQFVKTGLKVMRSWGYATYAYNSNLPGPWTSIYASWFQLLNQTGSYVNYGSSGLRQFDYFIHAAEANNIYVVLPLVDYNSGIGGIDLYQQVFGCNETQWYTDTTCQGAYRSYVQTIVNRYKSSPAIFAWEIMNEPRCHLANGNGCNTTIIRNWAAQTSAWVKSLDPKHMVTLGEEGWFTPKDGYGDGTYAYTGDEGADFVDNLAIPTIDYGTVHCYPQAYGYPASWGNTWIQQHDQAGAKAGKPVVIEEYGENASYTGVLTWQQTILKNTSIAMDSIWDFGAHTYETGPCNTTCPVYRDDLSLFYGDKNYTTYITNHATAMLAKKVT